MLLLAVLNDNKLSILYYKEDTFLLHKKNRRFVKIEGDDILRINGSAQVMKLVNEIFVLETKNYERIFASKS